MPYGYSFKGVSSGELSIMRLMGTMVWACGEPGNHMLMELRSVALRNHGCITEPRFFFYGVWIRLEGPHLREGGSVRIAATSLRIRLVAIFVLFVYVYICRTPFLILWLFVVLHK